MPRNFAVLFTVCLGQEARRCFAFLSASLLAVACAVPAVAPSTPEAEAPSGVVDGPYVWPKDGGWIARRIVDGAPKEELAGRSVAIGPIGSLPSFSAALRAPAALAQQAISEGRTPIFVLADTHGEYEIAVEMLQRQGVIDSRLRWAYGKGHLVVLGDVFDRGPHQVEILWLLYQLEAEAAAAGGAMHLLLGNHEVMALTGDVRYLHPRHRPTAQALGANSYSDLFDLRSVLGQWLRTKPAILTIGRTLFVHGGISNALIESKMTLEEANAAVRAALGPQAGAIEQAKRDLILKRLGPLWYRGYFPAHPDYPQASTQDIDRSLAYFGVCRIFVGHTIVPTVTPLFDGRIVAVQVYPRRDPSTGRFVLEAVIIDEGGVSKAGIDGSRQPLLPSTAGC